MSLRHCCCCFSLRNGTIAIGVFHITLASLLTALGPGLAIYWTAQGPQHAALMTLILIPGVLHLTFSSLLMHGVRRGHRSLVLAWLIYSGVTTTLMTLCTVTGAVLAVMSGGNAVRWLLQAAAGIMIGVFWYCFAVVLQYHYQLRRQQQEKNNSRANLKKEAQSA